MEYILNNTMLALLEYPEPSLLGINRMLTDKDFRKRVIANIQDPTVRNAWDELMKWDDKRWSEAIAALVEQDWTIYDKSSNQKYYRSTKINFQFPTSNG